MKLIKVFRTACKALFEKNPVARRFFWDYGRFRLAELLAHLVYPPYPYGDFGSLAYADEEFRSLYEHLHGHRAFRFLDRRFTLDQLGQWVRDIPGDSAECGAYEGASSYLMCRRLLGTGKTHFVFDSFAGLSEPGPDDGIFWAKGWLAADKTVCLNRLREFPFVQVLEGWIPDRFPEVADRSFCFLHIDVDLWKPTQDSLEFFYPRLNPGAVLVCDDYGSATCPGAKKAMDSFFRDKPERICLLPTGQGIVIKR